MLLENNTFQMFKKLDSKPQLSRSYPNDQDPIKILSQRYQISAHTVLFMIEGYLRICSQRSPLNPLGHRHILFSQTPPFKHGGSHSETRIIN